MNRTKKRKCPNGISIRKLTFYQLINLIINPINLNQTLQNINFNQKDYDKLVEELQQNQETIWIMKPVDGWGGRGILVFKRLREIIDQPKIVCYFF